MRSLEKKSSCAFFVSILCLLLMSGVIIGVAAYHGFFLPYTNLSDDDTVYVAQTLLFNAGMAQTYFDHTGYIYILVVSKIFVLLHLLHVIPVDNFHSILVAKNFNIAFSQLVFAGRFISLFFSIIFVYTFYFIVNTLTNSRSLGVLLSVMLASTTGIAIQSMIIRPEMMSAYFGMLAFFLFVRAFQGQSHHFFWLLFFAAFFNFLALAVKLQAIIQFIAIPFLAIGFAYTTRLTANQIIVDHRHKKLNCVLFAVSLLFFAELIGKVIVDIHFYQLIVIMLFALWLRLSRLLFSISRDALTTITLCLFAGSAIGFYCYYIHYANNNVVYLFHFFTHLMPFAPDSMRAGMIHSFLLCLKQTLFTKISFVYLKKYPINLLASVLLLGAIYLFFKNQKIDALFLLFLLSACIFTETLFHFRYYCAAYHIYIEYLYLMGIAFLCMKLHILHSHAMRLVWLIGAMIAAFSIASNLNQIQKNTFTGMNIYQKPEHFCDMLIYTPPLQNYFGTLSECRVTFLKTHKTLNRKN